MFPGTGEAFGTVNAGKFLLHDGQNIITIGNGWGYFGIDYITIKPTVAPVPVKPPKQLTDARATSSTKALFSYMVDMYGSKVLSGQQEDVEYIRSQTGKYPAIGAFDLMDYSPSRIERGANPTGNSESYISWAKKGEGRGIISLSWHWNAPTDLLDEEPDKLWWSGFYTRATTFDLAAALADKNSERYKLLIRDIDAIAVQLKKFQDADVPVLWRPLHEAAGGWFWWGAKGPDAFKELWEIMYERLENYHQLHNLIWVYTASPDINWYPGDRYVDVVGLDIYTNPSANMSGDWASMQNLFGGKKLVSLSESGTLPDPDKVRGYGTWWSWFSIWSGGFIQNQPLSLLQRVYNDEDVITRDELPDWRAYGRPSVRITQPAEHDAFLVCQSPVLQATAINEQGLVAKVTFLANGQVIGTDSVGSDGWQVTWTSPTAGTNSITAEAASPDGIVGVSSPVSLTIKADDVPPVITVSSAKTALWPVNHRFYTLKVSDFVTGLSDNCGSVPAVKITQVSSDEAANASGTGNTARDIIISDDGQSVQLRAERSGNGNGRVYTIQVAAADQYGNTGTAAYEVQVPHDQQKAAQADAAAYTVNEHNITSVSAGAALSGASYVEAAESTVAVYPNPATSNHITIEIYADNAQTVTISLLSATSQKMVKIQKSLETGNNVLQLPLDKVSDGMYVLLVEKENEQITRKLIIAR